MNNFIIPSIDLLGGKVVRLYKGNYNEKTSYDISIDDLLEKYKNFNVLHLVDLNGAKGEFDKNQGLVEYILQNFKSSIQIGGGIRNIESAKRAFNIGAKRVVIGTLAIKNPIKTLEIIDKFSKEKVVIAIDVEKVNDKYIPKANGWQEATKIDLFDLLDKYNGFAKYILCTDISVDGTMEGSNVELYMQIKEKFPDFVLQASGGVSSIEDIKKLQQVTDNIIVGRAFYENLIDFIC